jgi:hypothetical protein
MHVRVKFIKCWVRNNENSEWYDRWFVPAFDKVIKRLKHTCNVKLIQDFEFEDWDQITFENTDNLGVEIINELCGLSNVSLNDAKDVKSKTNVIGKVLGYDGNYITEFNQWKYAYPINRVTYEKKL